MKATLEIYAELQKFDGTPRALGMPNAVVHEDRLALAAALLGRHRPQSVLDVGCGYGDLRGYLTGCDYLGVDAHLWLIQEARRRYPGTPFRNVRFEDLPLDPLRFDSVAALGVLCTVRPAELDGFVGRLMCHGHRTAVISFLPPDPAYRGAFNTHAEVDVVRGHRVLERGLAHDEVTVVLDLTP